MSDKTEHAISYGAKPANPLVHADMLSMFRSAVAEAGERPALIYFDASITYRELDVQTDALAVWLRASGCEAGDRIMINLQNIPQFVMMVVAAWKVGAIPVPVNPMYTATELCRLITDSAPKVVLCLDHQVGEVRQAIAEAGVACAVLATSPYAFQNLDDHRVLPPRATDVDAPVLEDVLSQHAGEAPPNRTPDGEALGLILYTSGTTGVPKGAMLRHSSLSFNSQSLKDWCEIDEQGRILAIAPYFHITGFVCHIGAAFCARAAQVLNYRVQPSLVLEMIRRHRPTFTIGAITVFNALADLPDITPEDMASFDRIYSGGAPISPSLLARIENRLGIKIHSSYGMTEVAAPTHLAPHLADIPVDPASGALSIGVLEPGTAARIVDDEGNEVPTGHTGELLVKGPQVMVGYWRKPEDSAVALKDGWMHTGDVAFVDEHGWYYLVDRIKDVIIASGFKVWPREVEDTLYSFPGVREAAVVGVPDSYRGETVKAIVSLQPGVEVSPDALIAHCRENLAAYKVPRIVEIMADLPKTATGKIQRLAFRTAEAPDARNQ